MERLQKIISAAGVASRRKAEELITSGLVQVNGQTVTELGTKADAGKDHIRVDGKLLKFSDHHVYILLNKPKGYVTTLSDPEGRPTILDLLRGVKARVYPIGRLDYASEGLLLLTNDGELANALTKASSHVPKTYLVKIDGQPSEAAIEQLRAGIELPDRKGIHSRTAPAGIQLVHKAENPWYEVTLIEGRNRQVRAMFEQTGHHVEKLKRVRYGPFTLDVHPGKFRNLLPEEVEQLRAAIQRGSNATVESAVRPDNRTPDNHGKERKESYMEAELREEGRSPVKVRAESAPSGKLKRTPRPLGTVASRPRTSSSLPERARPGGFRDNAFDKKRPGTSKFRRDDARPKRPASTGERPAWKSSASRSSAPRVGAPKKWDARSSSPTSRLRTFDRSDPRPVRPAGTGERPAWKGPDAPGSSAAGLGRPSAGRVGAGRPSAGAPRKWTQGAPTSRPRPYDKSASTSDRSARSGPRPEWKKPSSFRSKAPSSFGPRKWTNNAPSPRARAAASDRPKPEGFQSDTARPLTDRPQTVRPTTARPSAARTRTDRPSKPRFKEERGGAGRSARPDAPPARAAEEGKTPFWQNADKRRPRKPKEEGDSERRPAPRAERPRRAGAAGTSSSKPTRPKYSSSKPGKNRPR